MDKQAKLPITCSVFYWFELYSKIHNIKKPKILCNQKRLLTVKT